MMYCATSVQKAMRSATMPLKLWAKINFSSFCLSQVCCNSNRRLIQAWCQWLMPLILTIQEAEIWRITVQSQPGQIVCKTLSLKTIHKNRAGGVF
jgi:hypothetical protein